MAFFSGGIVALVIHVMTDENAKIIRQNKDRIPKFTPKKNYYVGLSDGVIIGVSKIKSKGALYKTEAIAQWLKNEDVEIEALSKDTFYKNTARTPIYTFNMDLPLYVCLRNGEVKSIRAIGSQQELDGYLDNNPDLLTNEYQVLALNRKSPLLKSIEISDFF